MNILYVGRFFPPGLLNTVKEDSKGKVGFSNHNFEMSLLKGLSQQQGIRVHAVTCPGVFSYPHNNTRFFTHGHKFVAEGIESRSCAFCNLVGINRFWQISALKRAVQKEIMGFSSDESVHIIVNTPNYVLLKAIAMARKGARKHTTLTVVIPDIPSMITSLDHYNPIKNYLVKKFDRDTISLTEHADHLVLLTEQMKELYRTPSRYIVMEGLKDVDEHAELSFEKKNEEIILYTGTLRKQFGVLNLLEAFEQMKHKAGVQLWICGSGDAEDKIREAAVRDKSIIFYGLVSGEKASELQKKATILVNPRTSEGEYTKYSFPSKTIEYLLAGKSVVMNRLPGIPEEYFNYVYTPKDETVSSLSTTLQEVIDTPWDKRLAVSKAGYEFIRNAKNAKFQVSRIIDLIRYEG